MRTDVWKENWGDDEQPAGILDPMNSPPPIIGGYQAPAPAQDLIPLAPMPRAPQTPKPRTARTPPANPFDAAPPEGAGPVMTGGTPVVRRVPGMPPAMPTQGNYPGYTGPNAVNRATPAAPVGEQPRQAPEMRPWSQEDTQQVQRAGNIMLGHVLDRVGDAAGVVGEVTAGLRHSAGAVERRERQSDRNFREGGEPSGLAQETAAAMRNPRNRRGRRSKTPARTNRGPSQASAAPTGGGLAGVNMYQFENGRPLTNGDEAIASGAVREVGRLPNGTIVVRERVSPGAEGYGSWDERNR